MSRVASVGLAAVLLFLGGFALWSSHRNMSAAQQLKDARRLSNAYSRARFATDDERLLEHRFMIGHGGDYSQARRAAFHRQFDRVAARATAAIQQIGALSGNRSDGDRPADMTAGAEPGDGDLAADLLATQRVYHRQMHALIMSASMGASAMAYMQGTMADRAFNRLNGQLTAATKRTSAQTLARLNSLSSTETNISNATLVAIPLALLLVVAFWLMLRAYRRQVQDLTRAEFERLQKEALIDSLTQLRNHRAFQEDLKREVARADRSGEAMSLVLVDLDDLKRTNDSFGHHVGDERLRALAEALRSVARQADTAYRIGGDEFALILADTRAWAAYRLVQRLQLELARMTERRQSVTAGLAESGPGIDRDKLIEHADVALLEAKATHRGALVYGPELGRPHAELPDAPDPLHVKTLSTALARAVDAKDALTRSHSETVATTCALMAGELGLDPERVGKLRLAGLLHDVGKIGIPDAILAKPAPLDELEWETMRAHPMIGHEIVAAADLFEQAAWVLHHHERIDGTGYPHRLAGVEIPLESRIIFVADAFEAMTSDRPYRAGRPDWEALEELERNAGSQFDADCVAALKRVLARRGELASAA